MKRIVLSSIILILTLYPGIGYSQEESSPLIYYFSPGDEAFIIENADGSNREILADFTVPDGQTISGPGWSPSGSWFAWRATRLYNDSTPGYIVNRDNREEQILLDGTPVTNMQWSPTNDLLLLTVRSGDSPDFDYQLFVVSAETQNTLLAVDGMPHFYGTEWTPSGNYIVEYLTRINSGLNESYGMRIISLDGSVQRRTLDSRYSDPTAQNFFAEWSDDDKVVYMSDDQEQLVIEDFRHNEIKLIEAPEPALLKAVWSPDGKHIAVNLATLDEFDRLLEDQLNLYLVSIDDEEIHLVSEAVEFLYENPSYLSRFPGISYTWSPNGNHVAFNTNEFGLCVAFADSLSITCTDIATRNYQWINNSTLAFIGTPRSNENKPALTLYTLNSENGIIEHFLPETLGELGFLRAWHFSFSSGRSYLGIHPYESSFTIVDIANGDTRQITPINTLGSDNEATFFNGIEAIIWHPSENWFFTLSIDISGYWYPRLINAASADGSIQRELTICSMYPSCFGWVPSQNE